MSDQEKLPFIPIVIQFVDAISSDSNRVTPFYTGYTMLITQESTRNYGSRQVLPQLYTIPVPNSGIVRLKLLYLNKGRGKQDEINRYRVEYWVEREKLDEQFWVVPNVQLPCQTIEISNDGLGEGFAIPEKLYEVTRITPEVQYSIVDNLLYFDNSAPVGDYTIEYQPGLTLYDVVYQT